MRAQWDVDVVDPDQYTVEDVRRLQPGVGGLALSSVRGRAHVCRVGGGDHDRPVAGVELAVDYPTLVVEPSGLLGETDGSDQLVHGCRAVGKGQHRDGHGSSGVARRTMACRSEMGEESAP